MKSIRRSLIVYFLVLLALALGAVSAVVYRTSDQALQAKEVRTRELLKDRYDGRCRAEQARLDDTLLGKAQYLADLAQTPWKRGRSTAVDALGSLVGAARLLQLSDPRSAWRPRSFTILHEPDPLLALNELSAGQNPASLLLSPAWISDGTAGRTALWLGRPVTFKIRFADDLLPGPGADSETDYCQISSESGHFVQHSRSLGTGSLPAAPEAARKLAASAWVFDDVQLGSEVSLRRITMKAPMPHFVVMGVRMASRPRFPRRGGPRPPAPPVRRLSWPDVEAHSPVFMIEYARSTRRRNAALDQFRAEYKKDLASLETDTRETLAALRQHLLWISLLTFAASVVGGYLLVRLGLAPLHRLSEAVSRISEKDFRLQLGDARMPGELRPIVERLNQTLELLKRAFAREKQAAADISHELRTPLAALLTTIEVALRKPRSPEEYRELLGDCRESGKQMSQLVERMLALARLDAGVDTLRPREVDVVALAEQCVSLVRPLADARGLSLRLHRNGAARLSADPDKLREVLTNLLHNAIEYNRPDGAIDLTVERDNGDVRVEVRDTGIGISAAAREHIFERFYREDPSRQADGLHAGLGLAIVKGYVDLMGGTIGVDSTEGQGSTFHVRLPV